MAKNSSESSKTDILIQQVLQLKDTETGLSTFNNLKGDKCQQGKLCQFYFRGVRNT